MPRLADDALSVTITAHRDYATLCQLIVSFRSYVGALGLRERYTLHLAILAIVALVTLLVCKAGQDESQGKLLLVSQVTRGGRLSFKINYYVKIHSPLGGSHAVRDQHSCDY